VPLPRLFPQDRFAEFANSPKEEMPRQTVRHQNGDTAMSGWSAHCRSSKLEGATRGANGILPILFWVRWSYRLSRVSFLAASLFRERTLRRRVQ
jgi:hypothetical protein